MIYLGYTAVIVGVGSVDESDFKVKAKKLREEVKRYDKPIIIYYGEAHGTLNYPSLNVREPEGAAQGIVAMMSVQRALVSQGAVPVTVLVSNDFKRDKFCRRLAALSQKWNTPVKLVGKR